MIATTIVALLAIALLPAWSFGDPLGPTAARLLSRLATTIADANYAARRMRELQTEWPAERPDATDEPHRIA